LVWLGFRRDYPISEAMTSFFFTFFKVFLNGFLDLFVASNTPFNERASGWQAFF